MWTALILAACALQAETGGWEQDFRSQAPERRPALEVRYTAADREAFEIAAEAYRVQGDLRKPHLLRDADTGNTWLQLFLTDSYGIRFGTGESAAPSRINLYRRGPYYCEVRWLDLTFTDPRGNRAPVKGEIVLSAYPDRLYASVILHAEARHPVRGLEIRTRESQSHSIDGMQTGDRLAYSFPILLPEEPLPDSAFETIEGTAPLRFDGERGCHVIGSGNPGAFQAHFYHHPHAYPRVKFRVTNDERPRTIYVCHAVTEGSKGQVEGGVLLDEEGHPLPIRVQISKNFQGEYEEPFYNPEDTPFSETYFPITLAPHETRTITSLHLYQNWGRRPVKQFSSLGAWMDYFHSSTGVTETTCFVPFKFGGLTGIDIADLRAMSQATFWGGQPQYDNIAGHHFLQYRTGDAWRHLEYAGTEYESTGPNWMHVRFRYLSEDGAISATVESFEAPQWDELRNFVRVIYQVAEPVSVTDARKDLRLLGFSTAVQGLRYTHAAATGMDPAAIDPDADEHPLLGHRLPRQQAYAALYGEPKGSNAFVLRNWAAAVPGTQLEPAVTVSTQDGGPTRLWLTVDAEALTLPAGSLFMIEGFFLPYGDAESAAPAVRETEAYGGSEPRIVDVTRGARTNDFPPTALAEDNVAEFTLLGGRETVPVLLVGASGYRHPQISREEDGAWRPLPHHAALAHDGAQSFVHAPGQFGAVFLVDAADGPQRLRLSVGAENLLPVPESMTLRLANAAQDAHSGSLLLERPQRAPLRIETASLLDAEAGPKAHSDWREDVRGYWCERAHGSAIAGARLAAYESELHLQAWHGNNGDGAAQPESALRVSLEETEFAGALEDGRVHVLGDNGWVRADAGSFTGAAAAIGCAEGRRWLALAWEQSHGPARFTVDGALASAPAWPEVPPKRRAHLRGRLYCFEGSLDALRFRIRGAFPPP